MSLKKINELKEITLIKVNACAAAENAISEAVATAFAAQDALVEAEAEVEKAAIAALVEIATFPPTKDLAFLRQMLERTCEKVRDNRKMRAEAGKMFGGEQ
jgi:hypothetical protein